MRYPALRIQSRARTGALVALMVMLAACGGDSATGLTTSFVGSYSLKTVNGVNLPYVIAQTGQDKDELISGSITVNNGGSFTDAFTVRSTRSGQATTSSSADAGTWTSNGTAITFVFNNGSTPSTGSLSGNTLTSTENGLALVFTK